MNLIVLKGRLIADPEVKKVGVNQTTVCEFCIAVDRKFEKDKTDFINCVAWENTGEFIGKYFVKGKEISFRGELNIDQYEKDGEKFAATVIGIDNDAHLVIERDGKREFLSQGEIQIVGMEQLSV